MNNNFRQNDRGSDKSSFGPKRSFRGASNTSTNSTSRRTPSHNGFQKVKTNYGPSVTGERKEASFRSGGSSSGGHSSFGGGFSARPRFGSSRPSTGSFSRPSSGGFRAGFGGSRFGGRSGGGSRKNFKQTKGIDIARLINKEPVSVEVKAYVNKHQFVDFAIDDRLKANVITKGYKTPTPIQDQSIPVVLSGKDIVGLANTGTGKTAAFLIPLIHKILNNPNEKVLVVVPTRELAIQIETELKDFTKGLSIWGVVCVGGAFIVPQIKALARQHHFVIGTPGRIKDLIERKSLRLEQFGTVVLDEADRMLDMGFVNDIKYMMSLMPKERQTLFFSATTTPEIDVLISKFLNNPTKVSVRTGDTSKSVVQDIVKVANGKSKFETLLDLLAQDGFDKVLVFGRTKHGVEKLSKDLEKSGVKAESIHGNKTHGRRQKALTLFRDHHVQVLVATDVAARGLDISGVTHVINYDLPATYEDYVHRIGRTGRGGKNGIALSFVE